MIDAIELHNFKCFSDQPFKLGHLTILCGHNGAGKSSVIQSLLIAQQAGTLNPGDTAALSLNGPFGMELGTLGDVFCHSAVDRRIELRVRAEGRLSRLIVSADDDKLENRYLSADLTDNPLPKNFRRNQGFDFTYLSAERQGPRDTQATQSRPKDQMRIGSHGQFVAEVLAAFERETIRAELCCATEGGENRLLRQQVESWMGNWIPDLQVRANAFPGTNVAAVRVQRRDVTSEWMKPTNVGFGISYSLPIVVAGLLAPADGLLIVDSPESHLHPKGQSAVAAFLSTVAASGVQVIIETHSDHVLNGVRLAAKQKIIKAESVKIFFFDRPLESDGAGPRVATPELTPDGKLDQWPPGFFDEWETALHELL